jgi:hypothetical protein
MPLLRRPSPGPLNGTVSAPLLWELPETGPEESIYATVYRDVTRFHGSMPTATSASGVAIYFVVRVDLV